MNPTYVITDPYEPLIKLNTRRNTRCYEYQEHKLRCLVIKKAYETPYEDLLSDDISRAAEIIKQDAPGFISLSINILSYTKQCVP
jgi:hypothetical protein